ncbi:MAG: TIGR02186 family protein [Gemmatimonadetes bacterium]|nr:TIGR02186 family protein [Gemmatimonadota bacterium]
MQSPSRALAAAVLAAAFAVPEPLSPGVQSVQVEPSQVAVKMMYKGAALRVRVPVRDSACVATVLEGDERDLALKRKGKVLGLIWMNVGDVIFEHVPGVYLLRTSCPLVDLARPAVLEELGLGFGALGRGAAASDPTLRSELVRLKMRDGLWDVSEGTVTLEPGLDGGKHAVTDFFLPPKAAPGEYRVLVYVFEQGEGRLLDESTVQVSRAGVAAFISGLSLRHGLLYGILAVVVAAGAGLLTGVVFGLGGGKGH